MDPGGGKKVIMLPSPNNLYGNSLEGFAKIRKCYSNFFFLVGLGFELRALQVQSRYSALHLNHTPPVHFALVILEMWLHELFAWAGLDP
jgi:hypothetical protein